MSPNSYLDNAKKRQLFASTAPFNWSIILFFADFHGIVGLAPSFFSWPALGMAIILHCLFGIVGICLVENGCELVDDRDFEYIGASSKSRGSQRLTG